MSDVGLPSDVSENDLESPVSLRHGIAEEEGPRSSGALFDADSDVSVPTLFFQKICLQMWTWWTTLQGPRNFLRLCRWRFLQRWKWLAGFSLVKVVAKPFAMELYSPPRVLKASAIATSWLVFFALDLLTGWNFDQMAPKDLSLQILQLCTVKYLYCSPPRTMFSALMRLWNQHRMSPKFGIGVAIICCLVGTLHGCHQNSTSKRADIDVRTPSKSNILGISNHTWSKQPSWRALRCFRHVPSWHAITAGGTDKKKRTVIMTNDLLAGSAAPNQTVPSRSCASSYWRKPKRPQS